MTELPALAGSEGYAACDDEAKDMQLATTKRRICSLRRRSEAPFSIGRLWNPRSAECTSWERRSSGMTELPALAGSEGYVACDDEAKGMQLATTKRRICSLRRRSACRSPSTSGNPRSAECTSWERRSSEMTELSALAGSEICSLRRRSEGYAACDNEAQRRSPSVAYGTHEVQNALRGRGGAAK